MFMDVRERPCLVVGGGAAALRRVRALIAAGARVSVVARSCLREIGELAEAGTIALALRPFEAADARGHALVYSATGQSATDRLVSEAARAARIPVNVTDNAALSDFIVPAIVDRDPVLVAVSSGGTAPALARRIRAMIEALLPHDLGRIAARAEALRQGIKARIPSAAARRAYWERYVDHALGAARGGRDGTSGDALLARVGVPRRFGQVAIVGAGPGDPDLLTLRALQWLQRADVVIHDRLVDPRVLDYARRDAERIDVGKAPGRAPYAQAEISALLAHRARQGSIVVRLKGGDPFIFGRGGEELAHLVRENIPVEIVPGITAALGAAAASAIPLTHRGVATSITLVTGSVRDGGAEPDWRALARTGGTLAVYMGVASAHHIADRLVQGGLAPDTPVAIIENATLPNERIVQGDLASLAGLVQSHGIEPPALLLIGRVVSEARAPHADTDVNAVLARAS